MILISLLGDDLSILSPIINEYKDQITRHILIHDDAPDDVRRAQQFHNGLLRFIDTNDLKWETKNIVLDEDSKNDILRVYYKIRASHDEPILLHSTEGFASLSLILSNLVLADGGRVVVYDAHENEQTLIEGTNLSRSELSSRLSIDDYTTLLNYDILEMERAHSIRHRKEMILSLFKNHHAFITVRDALANQDQIDIKQYESILSILQEMEIVDEDNRLIPSEQMNLQGNLFEEYIFWLCYDLPFDDIAMSVKIEFDQQKNIQDTHRVKNEFDILMTHNNRIYTVECKLMKKLDGLELVYKYDGLIDTFGAGSKAILLNAAPNPSSYTGKPVPKNFNTSTIRRARMNDIEVYYDTRVEPIRFTNLVRNFFRLP
ncbi:MAG: DUF1887 family CARF protein [Sulfuricurvum sp.]|nr:DUF1887 family CARF protein [Sulfuricurvum sp.]